MKCIKCGHIVDSNGVCNYCGCYYRHIIKANNTANYYYNIGLEKAKLRDLGGAAQNLEKALSYNKMHTDARNLLGLVYYETGEAAKAYRHWKTSVLFAPSESNTAWNYLHDLENHPGIFTQINDAAKKYNLALSYAKQGSDDLALIQIKKSLSINPNFVSAHLLYALLHIKAGDLAAAREDVDHALKIDPYNTTARLYLSELKQALPDKEGTPQKGGKSKKKDKNKANNGENGNIRSIDYYEDPDKERWKQFVYMLAGLGIGILAMFILVIPSVRAGVSVDYNSLKKEYEQTVEAKDSEIEELKSDKETYQKKNKTLQKQLKVYEGEDGEDSMYDSILKASKAYSSGDYVTCMEELENVDESVLPSDTAKELYTTMHDNAKSSAADQLYADGKEAYNSYNYEEALNDFKKSYEYQESYSTLYFLAMCYKRTGDTETAEKYLYQIVKESGDASLIQQAANYGLEMTIDEAKLAVGLPIDEDYDSGYDDSDEDYEEDYSDEDEY